MGAVAEGDMLVGRALDVEREGVGEYRFVAVAGGIAEHHPVALGDPGTGDLGVFRGRAHEVLHRRDPADALLDQTGDQRRVGLDLGQLGRVLQHRPHGATGGVGGGVVAGRGGDDVVGQGLQHAQRRAVDLGVGQDGGQVFPGQLAAVLAHLGEVGHQFAHRGLDAGQPLVQVRAAVAGEVRVGGAEQLLCQLQHQRLVRLRHADHLHDHMQGIEEGHIAGEVAFAAE